MSNGDPIIIRGGGSIEIKLSNDTFPKDSQNLDRHYNADRQITRMDITDQVTGNVTECVIPAGGKCTITIYHRL